MPEESFDPASRTGRGCVFIICSRTRWRRTALRHPERGHLRGHLL